MIRSLVGASLRFKLVVLTIAAGVLVLGIQQARQMPVDATPEFAPPIIEVQTEALGLSAPQVEELVTLNLEELLNGTPWLRSDPFPVGARACRRSCSPLRARHRRAPGPASWSSERLTLAISDPQRGSATGVSSPFSSGQQGDDGRPLVGAPSRPSTMGARSPAGTSDPRCWPCPGVANVAIWGQRERQLQVQIEPGQAPRPQRVARPGGQVRPATRCGCRR